MKALLTRRSVDWLVTCPYHYFTSHNHQLLLFSVFDLHFLQFIQINKLNLIKIQNSNKLKYSNTIYLFKFKQKLYISLIFYHRAIAINVNVTNFMFTERFYNPLKIYIWIYIQFVCVCVLIYNSNYISFDTVCIIFCLACVLCIRLAD